MTTNNTQWIELDGSNAPKTGEVVQIAYKEQNTERVAIGWYCGKYEMQGDPGFQIDLEHKEDTDEFYVKPGWKSECLESQYYYPISNVTHYAPLLVHPNKQ